MWVPLGELPVPGKAYVIDGGTGKGSPDCPQRRGKEQKIPQFQRAENGYLPNWQFRNLNHYRFPSSMDRFRRCFWHGRSHGFSCSFQYSRQPDNANQIKRR
jgi:hypothetical protein